MFRRPDRERIEALAPYLGLVLFTVALVVLFHEIRTIHPRDVVAELERLAAWKIAVALGLTALNYAVLTGYDAIGLRWLGRTVGYGRVAVAAITGYGLSASIGMPILSGGSVRFRLYTTWGLSAGDVSRLVVFLGSTYFLGLFAVGGVVFLAEPLATPALLHLPFHSLRPLGVVCVALAGGYLAWTGSGKPEPRIGRWSVPRPSRRMAAAQLGLASADWLLSATILFVLLPPGAPGILTFLSAFLMAQIAGLVSQVPGGLGVFDTVLVAILTPPLTAPAVLGALIAYRAIYYLLPLLVALGLLAGVEFEQKGWAPGSPAWSSGAWRDLVPEALALGTFLWGAFLVVSGSLPGGGWLGWMTRLVPPGVVEVSRFLASVAGTGLLVLAWGLRRRLVVARRLTLLVLGAGIVLAVLRGVSPLSLAAPGVVLAGVWLARPMFDHRSALLAEPLTPAWWSAVGIVLVSALWLAVFANRLSPYAGETWWRFALSPDAPRFLRAAVAALGTAILFGLARLLRPHRRQADPGSDEVPGD